MNENITTVLHICNGDIYYVASLTQNKKINTLNDSFKGALVGMYRAKMRSQGIIYFRGKMRDLKII